MSSSLHYAYSWERDEQPIWKLLVPKDHRDLRLLNPCSHRERRAHLDRGHLS